MELESRIKALIAVGASITVDCQPCLQSTVAMALKSGANEQEIVEAITVGKRVRRGPISKMDPFASELDLAIPASVTAAHSGCECGHL